MPKPLSKTHLHAPKLAPNDVWRHDLLMELSRNGQPLSQPVFDRWVKKAEKVTGQRRHYVGTGNERRMYLNAELANAIRIAIKMRYA